MAINETDVKLFVDSWKQGVLDIRNVYDNKGDYQEQASKFLKTHYLFETESVLFKPTLTREEIFRNSFDRALSYFIGGDIDEDKGFAIQPWTKVRFENTDIILHNDTALAMGNYFFTDTEGNEVKVEYTFGYLLDSDGNLRINVHHSSVPFSA